VLYPELRLRPPFLLTCIYYYGYLGSASSRASHTGPRSELEVASCLPVTDSYTLGLDPLKKGGCV